VRVVPLRADGVFLEAFRWLYNHPEQEASYVDKSESWKREQLKRFVRQVFASWSSSNEEALLRMPPRFYYSCLQSYYDGKKVVYFRNVWADKKSFAERWPLRRYRIREGSIDISCNPRDRYGECNVHVIVDWSVENPDRNTARNGASAYDFGVSLAILASGSDILGDAQPGIYSENSTTLSRTGQ
jgi:hypothetical protein